MKIPNTIYLERDFAHSAIKLAAGIMLKMDYETKTNVNIQWFNAKDLHKLKLTKQTPVKGSIRTMRKAFDMLGVKQPQNYDIPLCLRTKEFLQRKVWESNFGEVRKKLKRAKDGYRLFIKPLKVQKGFPGRTVDEISINGPFLDQYPDSYELLVSDAVSMSSYEQRFWFFKRKYYDGRSFINYFNGKFAAQNSVSEKTQIFLRKIKEKIEQNTEQFPCFFAVDINTVNYNPVVVEINDGLSAGMVPTDNLELYSHYWLKRWYEIVGIRVQGQD